jgi:hypothetical protein
MVTMSQKSSVLQPAKSVSQALTPDTVAQHAFRTTYQTPESVSFPVQNDGATLDVPPVNCKNKPLGPQFVTDHPL